jgi:hypothetical protein
MEQILTAERLAGIPSLEDYQRGMAVIVAKDAVSHPMAVPPERISPCGCGDADRPCGKPQPGDVSWRDDGTRGVGFPGRGSNGSRASARMRLTSGLGGVPGPGDPTACCESGSAVTADERAPCAGWSS